METGIFTSRRTDGINMLSGSLPETAIQDLDKLAFLADGWRVSVSAWKGQRLYINAYKGGARWSAFLRQSWRDLPGHCESEAAGWWRLTATETPSEMFATQCSEALNAAY